MSRTSFAENQAMDAAMSRAASRAGSISTLWSSAEVPLCLDPRVQPSSDDFEPYTSRAHSIAGSISRNSTRSSQISMDLARLSIDIPNEYPRRPESIRLTPPRASSSSSTSGSSPSRVPSFNIGTIAENEPMRSSPISKFPYQPPSQVVQQKLLSSRFSEDTIDEPLHLSHSTSLATFGARLSMVPRKSSAGVSDISQSDSERSSSMQHVTDPYFEGKCLVAQTPTDLYRRAYRFFDKEYTVQHPSPTLESGAILSSLESAFAQEEQHQHHQQQQRSERPSLAASEHSHEGSLPSCSRSQASSTQASSSDSASAWSAESSLSRGHVAAPAIVTADHQHHHHHHHREQRVEAYLTPNSFDTTLTPKNGQRTASSSDKSGALSIPSLPSLPSFDSTLTATRVDHSAAAATAREIRRRPSTADVYSQGSQVSPHTFANVPLPLPPMPMVSPTEPVPVRYQVQSYSMAPASKMASSANVGEVGNSRSTTSRLLRARVASTPKLRLDASSLFPSEQALHVQHPVPPLPGRLSNLATDRRPSTSQMDGRAPFFGRRFRSRTLGESDRSEAANMQAAVNASKNIPSSASIHRPGVVSGLYTTTNGAHSMVPHRHPSQVSATSSELHSPLYMQPTPSSSICSASSPATTNSSLPVTPRNTIAFPRPKSRGTASASKSSGNTNAGWASYLNTGLTLHLEGDHGRVCQINMTYLAYDPFGRPEQLVEGTEAARSLTPKRPKSRGDKDSEAEQSGTLEFGPAVSEEMRSNHWLLFEGSKREASVLLKHLTVGEDVKADLLTRQATLSLKSLGNHQVSGYERKGRLAWKFAYRVVEQENGSGGGARRLVPLGFSCSATLLNPERARKSRLLNLVKKQMVPTLASKAVAASGSIDSPRSATYPYEDGMGTSTASPASSRRSNKQLAPEAYQPGSPIRRSNAASGVGSCNSPLRQLSRTAPSATSITSAESSFCSQPATPGRDTTHSATDASLARMNLQASPVSAQFGQPNPASISASVSVQRQLRSFASTSTSASASSAAAAAAAVAPALQLDLGPSNKLQEKASMTSLSTSSISSGSVQLAKPMVINGRKLIPISLPAGLARKSRIDPALLQANVVVRTNPTISNSEAMRQRSVSMHSSASGASLEQQNQRRVEEKVGMKGLLSNQPCMPGSGSRPPTASESIKLEYLARSAFEDNQQPRQQQQQQLRAQKSFAGPILTPSSFADGERQARRQRSKTIEDGGGGGGGRQRPFTADAWGESQYPSREQVLLNNARVISEQHHDGHAMERMGMGMVERGEFFASQRMQREEEEAGGFKPLPAPPRPSTRPRTAQTITNADRNAFHHQQVQPQRTIQGLRS
ncbi:uncharacterized protein UTRI_06464 [Ustilago trichophora]|uniref:Uncharacterized protein n=1 Tax=Ustilago trichophora TaxID=86804 RepID=A0A5C3EIP4_9BASI|nr:uncharacterized protein UTRI_06464 [Ustilago trichophora]